jgi:hypothetical protein
LNNMHGKQKAVATYPYIAASTENELVNIINSAGYTSKIEYVYKEKNENGVKKVDNIVPVLRGDADPVQQILGQTYDFVVDMRENNSQSTGGGAYLNFMLSQYTPPIPFSLSGMPSFDCFEETVRSVATTKVIYNSGILEKTIAYNNGSKITTTNLQWDPYTGEPLLTTVTNEFDKPVYNYSMPAYWFYPNMGSAADNYKATYYNSWNFSADMKDPFGKYDQFAYNGALVTIDNVSSGASSLRFDFWESNGNHHNPTSPAQMDVLHSKKSNQLSSIASTVSSLTNPITERYFPFFDTFNSNSDSCITYNDCSGKECCGAIKYYSGQFYFFKFPDCSSDSIIRKYCVLPALNLMEMLGVQYVVSDNINQSINHCSFKYYFEKRGDSVDVILRKTGTLTCSFEWKDTMNAFQECVDDILQASAIEFASGWGYDSTDIGIGQISTGIQEFLRIPNIIRSKRSNVFVEGRKQSGQYANYRTNSAYDGCFNFFTFFNHDAGNADNLQNPWTWSAEITKYCPFNFEIENRNALNIYSSALYGYGSSLATAVANNARYYEIGFDGFENDHTIAIGSPRGHIKCTEGSFSQEYAHTGNYSLKTPILTIYAYAKNSGSQSDVSGYLNLIKGKKYVLSCWVRTNNCYTSENLGNPYNLNINGSVYASADIEEKVDCWQRVEVVFTVPTNQSNFTLSLVENSSRARYLYFDDIRISPYNSTQKNYVYNPENYRLVAELDENNYATFYNYDEEGVLVQIKKETEKGIRTLQTTRQNLKH